MSFDKVELHEYNSRRKFRNADSVMDPSMNFVVDDYVVSPPEEAFDPQQYQHQYQQHYYTPNTEDQYYSNSIYTDHDQNSHSMTSQSLQQLNSYPSGYSLSSQRQLTEKNIEFCRESIAEDEEEDSPIEEVRATVPNDDDPSLPVMTFRFWVLGLLFTVLLAFVNQVMWFRNSPLTVGILVAQLLAYPLGKAMARIFPSTRWNLFGFSFTLNPGPFNMKEHVLITAMANACYQTAYAIDIIVIQKMFYHQDFGFAYGFLLVSTTQIIGFSFAGILRKYLVWPAAMVWPVNLVNCALFQTLHMEEKRQGQMTRLRFFVIAFICSFVYYWFPGYIMLTLTSISWVCWIKPNNIYAAQIGGGFAGLGVGAFSLDWNTIVSYLGSPLIAPYFVGMNILVGFVLVAWVMVPLAYYTNLWDAKRYPIFNSVLYTVDGKWYDPIALLDANGQFDPHKYALQGPVRITTFFALTYGIGFAGLTAVISHTILWNGKKIWAQFRQARREDDDIHAKLMRRYPEVPAFWYGSMLIVTLALSIFVCEYYPVGLPWWAVILAVVMAGFFSLPVGIIQAVTNQQPGLNIITEFVIGYLLPGRPIANVAFKTYGYIGMTQCLTFTQDLKLGHYMKVPPRAMFISQMVGTLIAGVINLATATWMMKSVPDLCQHVDNNAWTCPNANVFYSASVIWGVIGPARMFGPSSIYHPVMWFFLGGFLLPIPFYLIARAYPESWASYIHIPVLLGATGNMPPAPTVEYPSWVMLAFIFQFAVRRYRREWWARFNYVLSAALDSGVAVAGLVIFFTLQFNPPKQHLSWWGRDPFDLNGDNCNLAAANFTGWDTRNGYYMGVPLN